MSYLIIEDFRRGLDPRKFALGAPAGTLVELNNGHITNAGDIEKRKAFVEFSDLSILDDNGDQGIFGLQETSSGLTVFGSAGLDGSAPTLGQPELASALPVTSPVVSYQKLTHPAVLEGVTYDRTKHRMTALVWSELFGGAIQAIATFADGKSFLYSDGVFVEDLAAGLVLAHLVNDNPRLAAHLKRMIDLTENYSATVLSLTTTNRTRAGNVATLTLASNPVNGGLVIGSRVRIAGVTNAVTGDYNNGGAVVALTSVGSNSISYANVGTDEGSTADVGGTVTTGVITLTGPVGVEFDLAATETAVAGSITGPTNTVSPVQAVEGASARGSFTITGGTDNGVTPAAATGTITRTSTNAASQEYIQVGLKKYRFANTVDVEGDVKIGATAADTLTNLQRAINHTGTPGVDYICARAHPRVRAGNIAGNNLPLTAFKGSFGNTLVLNGDAGGGSPWTYSTFATSGSGAGNCISSVKVEKNGTEVELLADAVRFQTDVNVTAKAVRDAIVANAGVSGYTAEVNGATVTVLSSASASPMPNGYHLQICGNNVLVGECMFYLTMIATSFSISSIQAGGLELLGGAEAFPSAPIDTLAEYYQELVRVINSRSGLTSICAWTDEQVVKLSRMSTRDDDAPLPIYITPGAANTVGVVFGTPPPLGLPLTVEIPEQIYSPGSDATVRGDATGLPAPATMSITLPVAVSPTITGGNGALTYQWQVEYPALASGQVQANRTGLANPVALNYAIAVVPSNSRVTNVVLTITAPYTSAFTYDVRPVVLKFYVRLRVTDTFGNTALSDVCEVIWQIV